MSSGVFRFSSLFLFMLVRSVVVAQTVTPYITIDQFGYRPQSKKIAVIRDPQTGFDAAESFTPGTSYAVVNVSTGQSVYTASLTTWNSGATDASSGDNAWWFNFSTVTTPGKYYILDIDKNVRSYEFEIAENIYNDILKQAVRTFFYQRAGFKKDATFAGVAWADEASHLKDQQDKNARVYNKTTDASTARDVSGGWYDAGDYNKYTNWTANYVADFMHAYLENPAAWGDDYNIPESGNHVPDILDEAKWGVDHLLRMQNVDGSVLSIVGLAHASPPSSATGPSYYGTANTSGTLNTAAALALASKVYGSRGMETYAITLKESAIKAWDWAVANPNVIFRNNENATAGLGAGQQETDDYGRLVAKLEAAVFLFEITGDNNYKTFFDSNYMQVHLIAWSYAYPFETANQEILLYYTTLPNATASVVTQIKNAYKNAMNGTDNFPAYTSSKDPYQAYIKDYTWGSNATKGSQSLMYLDMITYGVDASKNQDATDAAEGFVHYLHGVNPLGFVYLSNMYAYGAEKGVNEFYHTWFGNGSAAWDRVGTSTYGPAPGFVTGGPNPSYDRDGCCANNSCGGSNAVCTSESLIPPMNQPAQKSYKDFNTSWPLNSWSVTENSNGYQLNYIRMLSRFVVADYDCSGAAGGAATFDSCGICSGGSTGITPQNDASQCVPVTISDPDPVTGTRDEEATQITVSPNPASGMIYVKNMNGRSSDVEIINTVGTKAYKASHRGDFSVYVGAQPAGMYLLLIHLRGGAVMRKIMVK